MTAHESAADKDSLPFCAYFGGPHDGFKTGDLPAELSGKKLTGMVSKVPLAQPAHHSLYAVYTCTSETQVDGFWRFDFQGLEGPNGEKLVSEEVAQRPPAMEAEFRELCIEHLRLPAEEAALLTDAEVLTLIRAEYERYLGRALELHELEMLLRTGL